MDNLNHCNTLLIQISVYDTIISKFFLDVHVFKIIQSLKNPIQNFRNRKNDYHLTIEAILENHIKMVS